MPLSSDLLEEPDQTEPKAETDYYDFAKLIPHNQKAPQVPRMAMGEGLGSFLSLIGPFTAQVRWFLGCGEVH